MRPASNNLSPNTSRDSGSNYQQEPGQGLQGSTSSKTGRNTEESKQQEAAENAEPQVDVNGSYQPPTQIVEEIKPGDLSKHTAESQENHSGFAVSEESKDNNDADGQPSDSR